MHNILSFHFLRPPPKRDDVSDHHRASTTTGLLKIRGSDVTVYSLALQIFRMERRAGLLLSPKEKWGCFERKTEHTPWHLENNGLASPNHTLAGNIYPIRVGGEVRAELWGDKFPLIAIWRHCEKLGSNCFLAVYWPPGSIDIPPPQGQ